MPSALKSGLDRYPLVLRQPRAGLLTESASPYEYRMLYALFQYLTFPVGDFYDGHRHGSVTGDTQRREDIRQSHTGSDVRSRPYMLPRAQVTAVLAEIRG